MLTYEKSRSKHDVTKIVWESFVQKCNELCSWSPTHARTNIAYAKRRHPHLFYNKKKRCKRYERVPKNIIPYGQRFKNIIGIFRVNAKNMTQICLVCFM